MHNFVLHTTHLPRNKVRVCCEVRQGSPSELIDAAEVVLLHEALRMQAQQGYPEQFYACEAQLYLHCQLHDHHAAPQTLASLPTSLCIKQGIMCIMRLVCHDKGTHLPVTDANHLSPSLDHTGTLHNISHCCARTCVNSTPAYVP